MNIRKQLNEGNCRLIYNMLFAEVGLFN